MMFVIGYLVFSAALYAVLSLAGGVAGLVGGLALARTLA